MTIRRFAVFATLVGLLCAQAALAHDPRTAAKDFSHSLIIEGVGKLTVSYKSLHFNEQSYNTAKTNEQLRNRLNNGLWKKIGKLDSDFDALIGGVKVPKGSYSLGINFDANDNFKLVLGGASEISVPLKTATDGPSVSHMTFDIRPTDDAETFLIEARNGKFRATADLKVVHEHK
jgi:hypothetical protein